jgi:hypothetical protein
MELCLGVMSRRIETFQEFWTFYVHQHSQPLTRGLHFMGTAGLILVAAGALLSGHLIWLTLLPVVGYGFAWAAHLFVERNRPATFTYPLWSLAADFVMFGKMLRGRMDAEVERIRRTPSP